VWKVVKRWFGRLLKLCLLLAVVAVLGLWLVLRSYEADLPSTDELKHYDPPQVTRLVARDGSLLAELFVERRTVVAIGAIPKVVKIAVLAAEDADFYRHQGLDYLGMLRALLVNLRSASARQGGSTITQQVVKNVLLSHERTFERKARELLLARRIEQELSKDEILELYLNHIYFGHGRYGIEEASRYYFGKSVGLLTLAESATLAGLPKGPGIYSPRINFERCVRRRNRVLDQVALKGFDTAENVARAKASPLMLAAATESLSELAPEVVSEVRRALRQYVGPSAARGGYTVETTIDPVLQAAARKALRHGLDAYAKRHGLLPPLGRKSRRKLKPFEGTPRASGHRIYHAVVTGADDARGELLLRVGTARGRARLARRYNPRGLPPSRFAKKGHVLRVSALSQRDVAPDGTPHRFRLELGPQSALVAIDNQQREILALVGSYEALPGHLDRTRAAKRQTGSAFKTFVYSYGIHTRRLTAATIVNAKAVAASAAAASSVEGQTDGVKPLRLRDAVAKSDNDAAVWALRQLGPESVARWAQAMGIRSKLGATDSLALGAYESTPREMAASYATLAAGGEYLEPRLIRRIIGPGGIEVKMPKRPPARRVMAPEEAYVMTSLLRSVVQHGTGRKARSLGPHIAGKTGTSNDARDAWFAGYSTRITCVVWTGYDDNRPLGSKESGATAALPVFIALMQAAKKNYPPGPRKMPAHVKRIAIDPRTGLLPYPGQEDSIEEIFIAGTEPSEHAEDPNDGGGGSGGAGGSASASGGAGAGGGAGGSARAGARASGGAGGKARQVPSAESDDAPPPF
jgi:penicillin-binding protein 1A